MNISLSKKKKKKFKKPTIFRRQGEPSLSNMNKTFFIGLDGQALVAPFAADKYIYTILYFIILHSEDMCTNHTLINAPQLLQLNLLTHSGNNKW